MSISPLAKKLQIKPGHDVLLINAPDGYADSLRPLPEDAAIAAAGAGRFDHVHLFVISLAELSKRTAKAIRSVKARGHFWIVYPKKTSAIKTDINRDTCWKAVGELGWQGIAMVAVDETWSAMRFRPEAEVGS